MYIVNSVLGDASGGRWQVVCDYARLLQARGHRVLNLLSKRHTPNLDLLPDGCDVEFVSSHGHYDLWAAWRQRRRFTGGPSPDLAIAHCSRSVALLKRSLAGRAPLLAVSHSPKVRRLLAADACLALNRDIGARFSKASAGKPSFVVPNMIPVDVQVLPPWRRRQPLRLGALGRFDPVKGFDVFIDALGYLKQTGYPFTAQLAGEGAEKQALQRRAEACDLAGQLSFPGWIDDVDRFLTEVDILCVPARSDAFGLTPLQAARAGVPMVLSRAVGHGEMFMPDTQALFAAIGDARETAGQMARLAEHPGLAERLRQSAFKRLVTHYSTRAATERLIDIIENQVKIYSI